MFIALENLALLQVFCCYFCHCWHITHSWLLFPNFNINIQFSPTIQSHPTLCNPMDCSMPGLPVHHQLPAFTQTHVYWVGDAIQSSHPLLSPSPPAFNFSQHQGLFKRVSSLHQVAKELEIQLQHQSFQWIFRLTYYKWTQKGFVKQNLTIVIYNYGLIGYL